jgi:hypothetical protein
MNSDFKELQEEVASILGGDEKAYIFATEAMAFVRAQIDSLQMKNTIRSNAPRKNQCLRIKKLADDLLGELMMLRTPKLLHKENFEQYKDLDLQMRHHFLLEVYKKEKGHKHQNKNILEDSIYNLKQLSKISDQLVADRYSKKSSETQQKLHFFVSMVIRLYMKVYGNYPPKTRESAFEQALKALLIKANLPIGNLTARIRNDVNKFS